MKKEKKAFQKIGTTLKKKWLIDGTKTIILVAIIIAIYIGVNILLKNIVLPEIDCTENKVYSLSQETKDKLKELDKDINITVINYSYNPSVINFVERYVELNNRIKIEKVDDLSARTDLMQTYSLNPTESMIIVKSEQSEKTLKDEALYTYDYSTGKEINITEEAITNAIIDVTIEEKNKIYFMSNNTMYTSQYFSTVMEEMEKEANKVETVDILVNGGVPEDCDTLVISTLQQDLTEQESDKIIEYIHKGGELLLMCASNINDVTLTNFQKVLDEYGITITNGVVFEGDSNNMVSGYPDFIVEQTQNTSLTQNLNMTMDICFIDAAEIVFNEEKLEELGVEYETLIATTNQSFVRKNLMQTSITRTLEDSEEKTCTVAAIATKTIEEGKISKLIIYGNEFFAMDMPIPLNNSSTISPIELRHNKDLILNSIAYLNEKENTITIRKNYDTVKYTVTEQQNKIIMIIIFVVPIAIIVAGIIIWQIRRRKK